MNATRADPGLLPPLFVAHLPTGGEPSELPHAELKRRWEAGEPEVVAAMAELGELAAGARAALLAGDRRGIEAAMDGTFDVRRRVATLDPRHVELVQRARSLGCAANFSGSGGAIVGTYESIEHRAEIERSLGAAGAHLAGCEPAPQLVHK